MPEVIGGLRKRYIKESLIARVSDGIDALNWTDSNRKHKPVTVLSQSLGHDEEALPNLISISIEDNKDREYELGSNLNQHQMYAYVDVFAESEALGMHIAGDIKDLIAGRFVSLGQSGHPRMSVLNYSEATPSHLFYVDFEDIREDRSRVFNKPFQEFWWVISFVIYDYYSLDS